MLKVSRSKSQEIKKRKKENHDEADDGQGGVILWFEFRHGIVAIRPF